MCRCGSCSAAARLTDCRPMRRAAGRMRNRSATSSNSYIEALAASRRSRCGLAPWTARRTVSAARVKAARKALGPLGRTDGRCAWHLYGGRTRSVSSIWCADCDLAWFEEPVIGDDKPGMAEVRASGNACRLPRARARRRASTSAILPC
jgi:L-alanine-DL-glutamate epimerase-like enolase superfamily enzyme